MSEATRQGGPGLAAGGGAMLLSGRVRFPWDTVPSQQPRACSCHMGRGPRT